METYFDFAVDRFRRPQSTWFNRSLRLAFKVVLNFLEAHRERELYYYTLSLINEIGIAHMIGYTG